MLDTIKKMFGGNKTDIAELIQKGSIILDVRTNAEFAGGHAKGAINVPLNELNSYLKMLKRDKPIITCCASGVRSSSAASILKNAGYEAYNGGSWASVQSKITK